MLPKTNSTPSSKILGYQATTSLYGRPIAVPYGRCRVSTNVIWTGGWAANPVNGGKGNKGKGGTQQYDYITNVLMALGEGPVSGVYSIWRDKDEFNLAYQTDYCSGVTAFTSSIGGIGKPYWWVTNVAVVRNDGLVTITTTDPGSPGPVTITRTQWTPMVLVPSSPAAGQYTISGVGGPSGDGYAHYGFSPADAASGKQIAIVYGYQINNYSTQGSPMEHLNLVLFSGTLGQPAWNYLLNNPAFENQALGYSETAYIGSGEFDLGSAGVIPNLNFEIQGRCGWQGWDPTAKQPIVDCNPADVINDILSNPLTGVLGWSTPGSGTAVVPVTIGGSCNIGSSGGYGVIATSGSFSSLSVGQAIAINGGATTIATIPDSTQLTVSDAPVGPLTGSTWSAVVLESQAVVTGSSLWLPLASAADGIGSGGQVYAYCAANGLFVSRNYDETTTGREVLNQLLEVANSDAFWSEGTLKFGCYGDTTAAGNNFVYSPATAPIYDVNDAHFVAAPGSEPVDGKVPDVRDVANEVTFSWTNRSANYATNTLPPAQDSSMVAKYGRHPASSKSYPEITTQPVAVMVQTTRLKRSVYIDGAGTYELTLPPHFARIDPMDLITVTDAYMGFSKKPLRITRIEEDDRLCLKLTLEVFPWSCSAPTIYPSQGHSPTQAGYYAAAGHVNTPMFVALPEEVANGNPYAVGIALSGGESWGGAAVYVSTDGGNSYDLVGMCTGAAIMGTLTAALAASADPDTTANALQVNLTESYGELDSFTQAQADADVSLIAVDSELLSYATANSTGTYQYSLTYLRRGVYGTVTAAHAAGAPFCLVGGLFQYDYPASAVGQTLYFKFCSVNLAGQSQEDISQVVAYPCFVAGPRTPYPWAPGFETGDSISPAETFGLQPEPIANLDGSVTSLVNVLGNPPLSAFSSAIIAPVLNSVLAVATGGVKWVTIGAGGSGYLGGLSGQFALTFSTGVAAGYAVVVAGVVVNAIVTAPGAYGSAPTVSFAAGGGTGATGTAVLSTGGTVAAGTYSVGLTAFDAATNPLQTPLSNLILVTVTAASSELALNVTWPAGSYGGNLYAASPDASHAFHYESAPGVGRATSGVANYDLTAVGGVFFGPPDPLYDHMLIRCKRDIHAGSWAEPCSSVGSFTITWAGATFTSSQYTGRYVSLLAFADQTKTLKVWDAQVASNTATTLTLTVDPTGTVSAGDVIVKRIYPTAITSTSFTDADGISCFEPTGYAAHAESGNVAWIVRGPGAGQQRLIQDNTAGNSAFTLATPWEVLPTAGSTIIIVEPSWAINYPTHSVPMNTYSNFDGSLATIEVSNIAGETFIVQGLTVDADGGYDDTNAPVREIYMPGQPGGNSGAKITFSKRGNLAIASNVAGVAILNAAATATGVVVYIETAPVGHGVTVNINLGGVLWMALTVAAGTNSVWATSAQITAAAALAASTNITVDVTAVGTGPVGADLSVFIYT
jgi:hypothetical protein